MAAAIAACGNDHRDALDGGSPPPAPDGSAPAPDASPPDDAAPVTAWTVGGTVHGLAGGSLVLDNDNAEQVTVSANGSFTFPTAWPHDTYYAVTVRTGPLSPPQNCTVGSGTGAIADANVTTVDVECSIAATWRSVTGGYERTCGIQTDGSLWCWGDNTYGETTPAGTLNLGVPTAVASGQTWRAVSLNQPTDSFGIRGDGALWRWGAGGFAQVGTATDWAAIATTDTSLCGIKTDHTLWCMGDPATGGVTTGGVPQQVGTDATWASVAGYSSLMMAIHLDGSLAWWGNGGALTNGMVTTSVTPVALPTDGLPWAAVAPSLGGACGLRTDGTLWCWDRSVGDGTSEDWPFQLGTDAYTSISRGIFHVCVTRTDHTVWCAGARENGDLGDGIDLNGYSAELLVQAGGPDYAAVTAGDMHTCALRDDASIDCWGTDEQGQLGIHAIDYAPTRVRTPLKFTQSAASERYRIAFAVATDGQLWCWSESAAYPVPTLVAPGETWSFITGGYFGVGAIQSNGSVWMIGGGMSLTRISNEEYTRISAGDWAVYAIADDTTQWILTGSDINNYIGYNWLDVSRDDSDTYGFTCGITTGHRLLCWGYADPDGLFDPSIRGFGDDDYVRVASGTADVYALASDGSIDCMGYGCRAAAPASGYQLPPSPIVESGPWSAITARSASVCALKTAGSLWCWGDNVVGPRAPLAVPTLVDNTIPWAKLGEGVPWTGVSTDGGVWFWSWPYGSGNGDGLAYVPHRIAL